MAYVVIVCDIINESVIKVKDVIESRGIVCEIIKGENIFIRLRLKEYNFESNKFSIYSILGKNNVSSIWFKKDTTSVIDVIHSNKQINVNIHNETNTLKEYLFTSNLHNFKVLSSYSNKYLNKLNVLKVAQKVNLRIPPSIISCDKEEIRKFINIHEKVIVKASYENVAFMFDDEFYKQPVSFLTIEDLENIRFNLIPSLVQKYIPLEMEVRCFFFRGKTYSIVQFGEENIADIRLIDSIKKRTIFSLPRLIERKLKKLMCILNLEIASIDLIYDKSIDDFYFLEINPNGAFGNVSTIGNYNLESKIADYLIN